MEAEGVEVSPHLAAAYICFHYLALGEGVAEVEEVLEEAVDHVESICRSTFWLCDDEPDLETAGEIVPDFSTKTVIQL